MFKPSKLGKSYAVNWNTRVHVFRGKHIRVFSIRVFHTISREFFNARYPWLDYLFTFYISFSSHIPIIPFICPFIGVIRYIFFYLLFFLITYIHVLTHYYDHYLLIINAILTHRLAKYRIYLSTRVFKNAGSPVKFYYTGLSPVSNKNTSTRVTHYTCTEDPHKNLIKPKFKTKRK